MTQMKKMVVGLICTLVAISAFSAEWHLVPDEVYADVPLTQGPIIGAIKIDTIKKNGNFAEAQIAMFYNYDLVQDTVAKLNDRGSDVNQKMTEALKTDRPYSYVGIDKKFQNRGAGFINLQDNQLIPILLASEIVIEEGYRPMSVRTIQIQCVDRLNFKFRYSEQDRWSQTYIGTNNDPRHNGLFPFICDKVGLGQNDPAPPAPPSPEMKLLQQIGSGLVLPAWKFLGVYSDGYNKKNFIFYAKDTIKKKKEYTDVVVGSFEAGSNDSAPLFITMVQQGRYRSNSLNITHVHCDTETIGMDVSGAKVFESQLISAVCRR